jgi:ABC-type Fe3+/spermidine/putrescine transport system ATPase subunit
MIFLDEGVIVERGTPNHFFESPKSERVKHFLKQIDVLYGRHEELLEPSDREVNK